MSSGSSAGGGGIGLCEALGVLFVGLKLTGYIDWPWWAVTLPLWGPTAVALAVLAFALVGLRVVSGRSVVAATVAALVKRD